MFEFLQISRIEVTEECNRSPMPLEEMAEIDFEFQIGKFVNAKVEAIKRGCRSNRTFLEKQFVFFTVPEFVEFLKSLQEHPELQNQIIKYLNNINKNEHTRTA